MSDPAVCSFLTKVLCSRGGSLGYDELPREVGLPEPQLRQILAEVGSERFLMRNDGGSARVLAVSAVRSCVRKECAGCENLHLCKLHLKGKCRLRYIDPGMMMSDPAVCGLAMKITKNLCSNGGCLGYHEIPPLLGLPDHQLGQVLQDAGQERFLVRPRGSSCQVLAVSPVRLCLRNECAGCEHLHICKYYIKRRCFRPVIGRRTCKYSHDIFSESNRKVLKNHELSGLNDDELRILLLQNDPFLLPDVCNAYNKGEGSCTQQDNCTRLHVCRYFLRGQCRFPRCKRSHDLLDPNALRLLLLEGLDDKIVWNIQTICDHKTAVLSRELGPSKSYSSNSGPTASGAKSNALNQRESRQEQVFNIPTAIKLDPAQGANAAPSTKCKNTEKGKSDEICLYYVWRFCKNKNNCNMVHYDLPYRWQIYTGNSWKDIAQREEIEKSYCEPNITSLWDHNINFRTMTSNGAPVRRLSTPSSVTKPAKFVMTTKWLWYWKNDLGQWIEFGNQDGKHQGSNLGSDDLENLFLADPNGSIHFAAGSQHYEISFKDMIQKNLLYQTQREVLRRPKFVSSEDVKTKKGHTAVPVSPLVPVPLPVSVSSPAQAPKYPLNWDSSALPAIGYKAVELRKTSPEYTMIADLFKKTMSNYDIHRIKRIQNPSLWQVFQWQNEQMKKKKGGQNIDGRLLFHGTSYSCLEAICSDNFDWRICGTNGTVFGKGSYFARDAQYSHNYCQRDATSKETAMFVANVLVGDFTKGHSTYNRPPARSTDMTNCYDSCVDKLVDPSIFVIFEKHQIYPAYLIFYEEEKKCILS